jgi:hypothetical protein
MHGSARPPCAIRGLPSKASLAWQVLRLTAVSCGVALVVVVVVVVVEVTIPSSPAIPTAEALALS